MMMKQIIELSNGTFKVLNSKGTDYYVINRAGHCSCKGHGYRKTCRHVKLLKDKGLLVKNVEMKTKNSVYNLIPKWTHNKDGTIKKIEFFSA